MALVPQMPILYSYSITGRRNTFHRAASFMKEDTWKEVLRRMLDSVGGSNVVLINVLLFSYHGCRPHWRGSEISHNYVFTLPLFIFSLFPSILLSRFRFIKNGHFSALSCYTNVQNIHTDLQ
jgi:hypothetical protein